MHVKEFGPGTRSPILPGLVAGSLALVCCAMLAVGVAEGQTRKAQDQSNSAVVQPMQLQLSPRNAAKVAHQIWLNETGGIRDVITAWNASEDFASLGIGHFIWFPEGLDSRFDESFPEMLQYLRARGAKPPAWLAVDPVPAAPWATKAEFDAAFQSSRMKALRRFLLDTMDLQAEFLVLRLQAALPKLLANADDPAHIERQFARVVAASPDLYPLIDYVNFKGEGTKASEVFPNPKTGVRQGWGLRQVLEAMTGTSHKPAQVLREFSDAAAAVLLRRIANNPRDQRWQKNWLARVKSYRRPLE